MSFAIEELRRQVDERYVGIRLNTTKVKPVHIANGLFRCVTSQTRSTKLIHRFIFHQTAKGEVPRGHELESVLGSLIASGSIEKSIDSEFVGVFRRQLKRVLSADDGIFTGQMQSYSAGNSAFLSKDTVGQDAGEFIASWLEYVKSPLFKLIHDSLEASDDIVTQICQPLLENERIPYDSPWQFSDLEFASTHLKGRTRRGPWGGLESAASTLAAHLELHPDKLFRLRMAVIFSSLAVMRHISSLESYYDSSVHEAVVPFVLDTGNLRNAAKQSYSKCTQSIARFYAIAFGEVLKRTYSAVSLSKCQPPKYKDGTQQKSDVQGASIWKLKREEAMSAKNKFRVFGEAVFDILGVQKTSADPIRYFRGIGRRIGLLHPPNGVAVPWFSAKHDLSELLVFCCVNVGETIEFPEFCNRLWSRFGIVVGGGELDEQILDDSGIYNFDRNALRENQKAFGSTLVDRGLASELADGVMKVSLKG